MNRPSVSPKPLTGAKVLFMLLAFFGVVIGVNMIMMRLAIQTLPGTDVDRAYSASLAYEKEIATADIGTFVMEELKRLDKVAYVRFASVYRHFRDINEFTNELKDLLNPKE